MVLNETVFDWAVVPHADPHSFQTMESIKTVSLSQPASKKTKVKRVSLDLGSDALDQPMILVLGFN